jgi:hypothetical protein
MAIGALGEELLTATLDKGPRCRLQLSIRIGQEL